MTYILTQLIKQTLTVVKDYKYCCGKDCSNNLCCGQTQTRRTERHQRDRRSENPPRDPDEQDAQSDRGHTPLPAFPVPADQSAQPADRGTAGGWRDRQDAVGFQEPECVVRLVVARQGLELYHRSTISGIVNTVLNVHRNHKAC